LVRSTLIIAALVVSVFIASAQAAGVRLKAQTGPGYQIQIKKAGKVLKTIKAGRVTLTVEDKSSIHNFHLTGPGVNKSTGLSFVGEKTWSVKLRPGRYTYQCDTHASLGMKGSFKVTG
jgi:plastocyanin